MPSILEKLFNLNYKKTSSKNNCRIRICLLLSACFLFPCIVMLFVYHAYGITPFGDKSLLIMDMSAQYSEFFCGLKNISPQNGGILFSWSKVFGSNYAGVFAYYVASPLSILTLLCPNEYMPIGLVFLTLIKIGLCGLTFGVLMNYLHTRVKSSLCLKNRAYIVIFALFYALMSYNIVYSMCLMWIDAVIWLPVIILGIEKISEGGKPYLLCASFACLFISTYYIAYMVGIFSCIYLVFILLRKKYKKLTDILWICTKFAGSAITAAGIGAWLLLPTLYSLFEGKIGSSYNVPENGLNYEASDIIKKFFIGTYDSITNSGTPFFYCGIIVFAFFFGYFFIKSIPIHEKVMTAAITLFMGISTYYFEIDIMWHVFQKPNWFPYRYFFLFTFIVIFTAAKAFMHFKEIPYFAYGIFFLITVIFYGYVKKSHEETVTEEQLKYSIKILVIYMVLIFALVFLITLYKRLNPRLSNTIAVVLFACLLFSSMSETYTHALMLTEGLDKAHRYESYEKYKEYKILTEQIAEIADEQSDGEFYRIGSDFQRNFNESIGLGYAGISHYSSSYNKNINSFLKKLGFAQSYIWTSYAGSTTVTDSLFSVKYVINDPENSRLNDKGRVISWCNVPYSHYKTAATVESTVLYENPYVLTPCVAVSGNLKNFDWQKNAIESQNYLLNCMLDSNTSYFVKMTADTEGAVTVNKGTGYTEYVLIAPTNGPLYAYLPWGSNRSTQMQVNGETAIWLYTGETDCVQFLGAYNAGDEVRIKILSGNIEISSNTFYQLDEAAFALAAETLKANSLQMSDWSSGCLEGTITASQDGSVFTSLVYDKSWHVTVDGKDVDTWALKDGLLCFNISAGEHEIVVEYKVPGFAVGMTVTCLTVACIAVYFIINYVRSVKKKL